MARRTGAENGDMILIVAGPEKTTNQALSSLRHELGQRLEMADPSIVAFAFVIDFPLFEWDENQGRWDAMHHPFSMPKDGTDQYMETDPARVIGHLYDLVANGNELASGSIRIHTRELQERVFKVLGYTPDEVARRFGQLLTAFEYGTPPHGGIAPGDRQTGYGSHRYGQHPRRNCVPKDSERGRSVVWRAGRSGSIAVGRAGTECNVRSAFGRSVRRWLA